MMLSGTCAPRRSIERALAEDHMAGADRCDHRARDPFHPRDRDHRLSSPLNESTTLNAALRSLSVVA